jgi:tRNA(Leu) C34 or U34 (ribose-2'-O)-methylase TrmL
MTRQTTPTAPRLGIDIGRVIIDGGAGGADTAFFHGSEAAMLATPEMPGAVETIARLVDRFDGQVWLVSKCGPRIQDRTLRWLDGHDFYRRTGLVRDRVRFCRRRADKRVHCTQLALTHFVDDHPEVHAAIRGTVPHQYFFGPQRRPVPSYGRHAPTWADVERLIAG